MNEPLPGLKTHIATVVSGVLGYLVATGRIEPSGDIAEFATAVSFIVVALAGLLFRHLGNAREAELRRRLEGGVGMSKEVR